MTALQFRQSLTSIQKLETGAPGRISREKASMVKRKIFSFQKLRDIYENMPLDETGDYANMREINYSFKLNFNMLFVD